MCRHLFSGELLKRYETSVMKDLLVITRSDAPLHRAGLFRLLIVTIITVFLYSTSNAIEMKGMSYIAWEPNGLLTADSDTSLENIKKTGCNWIALCVVWFQDDVNSTLIEPDYSFRSSTPESMIHAIDKCHQLRMKVMLKPHVECRDETWGGHIHPSPEWFASYQNFINFWADIAESHNVELFCVGAELTNTTVQSSSWRNVVQDIRNHYSGQLVYAANPNEEKDITWWDELDYIGIDAYYHLTDENAPMLEELETAWGDRADAIESWRNSHWPNMQIIFTEVGYRSVDGVNKEPWLKPSLPYNIDLQEQADCYNALLSQCKDRQWWSGVFWWNWETNPNAGGLSDPYYTPQNKPAEAVIANCYRCLRGDFTRDYKINFEDFSMFAASWLSYHPSIDIYPSPYGDGIINSRDFAVFAKNWMANTCLDGDINGDCKVDVGDLSRLTSHWLRTCKPGSISEDINTDGLVNLVDYALLAESWMQEPLL